MPSIPVVKQQFSEIVAIGNESDTALDLLDYFDDPRTTGLVATFVLYDSSLGNGGISEVVLYDQVGAGAPLSVANFLSYVNAGAYSDSFIHRSVENFIIQGGRNTVLPGSNGSPFTLGTIASNASVQNEFSQDRPNTRGTIAFAKPGNDANGATKEWFFNLADNTNILDEDNNGGFSVFGEVRSQQDLAAIDGIANLSIFEFSSPFGELPLITDRVPSRDPSVADTTPESINEFARYQSISVAQQAELSFEVIANSNPALVTPIISGSQLTLDYADNQVVGSATLQFRATNLQGETVEDSVTVTLRPEDLLDFNGDRNSDLLWQNRNTGEVAIWALDGLQSQNTNTAFLTPQIDLNWEIAAAGDFAGDRNSEIFWRNQVTGANALWLLEGTAWRETVFFTPQADVNWQIKSTGDFNGDRQTDVLWRNQATGENVVWFLDGTRWASSAFLASVANQDWDIAATGDFSGDGKDDILWRNQATGQNTIWVMDGSQYQETLALAGADTSWTIGGTADYDRNGWTDIVWRNGSTGQNLIWTMEGADIIGGAEMPGVLDSGWHIVHS